MERKSKSTASDFNTIQLFLMVNLSVCLKIIVLTIYLRMKYISTYKHLFSNYIHPEKSIYLSIYLRMKYISIYKYLFSNYIHLLLQKKDTIYLSVYLSINPSFHKSIYLSIVYLLRDFFLSGASSL